MSPLRLERFLVLALLGLPLALRWSIGQCALRLLHARYPLAGCGVTYADGSMHVITVGRN